MQLKNQRSASKSTLRCLINEGESQNKRGTGWRSLLNLINGAWGGGGGGEGGVGISKYLLISVMNEQRNKSKEYQSYQ